ncbi:hypothetical protein FRX31_003118, partial [Thalictrum thalictroides]
ELVELSTWEFGPGELSVITENWRGSGSLLQLEGALDYAHITLKEAALAQFSIPIFSQELQRDLWEDYHLRKVHDSDDKRIWPHSSNGVFSIKSYIDTAAESGGGHRIFSSIWQNFILTKISFFFWKLLHKALPVDSAVIKCHIQLVSRCVCCFSPQEEYFIHLFYQGDVARSHLVSFEVPDPQSSRIGVAELCPGSDGPPLSKLSAPSATFSSVPSALSRQALHFL